MSVPDRTDKGPDRSRIHAVSSPGPSLMAVSDDTRCHDAGALRDFVRGVFLAAGCDEDEAGRIAHHLVLANLRGHESHGLSRVLRYLEWMKIGQVHANRSIEVLEEAGPLAVVDGRLGFGQTVGAQTIALGVDKARRNGVAVTALRNAGHLGCIGDWAERAAESGIASLHLVNLRGSLLVAPHGGISRRLGTSPFACGFPVAGAAPIVLDFATSMVAEGKAFVALRGGEGVPVGALVGSDGQPSDDPVDLYGPTAADETPNPNAGAGALTPFGLHKGAGLAFMIELFAGALTGSGVAAQGDDTTPRPFCNGMLSMYLAAEAFADPDVLRAEVMAYADFYKSATPARPGDEILIPGERERRLECERERLGVPISDQLASDLRRAAARVGSPADMFA